MEVESFLYYMPIRWLERTPCLKVVFQFIYISVLSLEFSSRLGHLLEGGSDSDMWLYTMCALSLAFHEEYQ